MRKSLRLRSSPRQTTSRLVLELQSPADTKSWVSARVGVLEVFITKEGTQYTRAAAGEDADAEVRFSRILGLAPMRLRLVENSRVVRRQERRTRRANRELRRRGLA